MVHKTVMFVETLEEIGEPDGTIRLIYGTPRTLTDQEMTKLGLEFLEDHEAL